MELEPTSSKTDIPVEFTSSNDDSSTPPVEYKLYKRRFAGCAGIALLNGVTAMFWPWFGPISNNTARDFGITLNEVNWLGNIVQIVYMPVSLLVPVMCARYGIRRALEFGTLMLLLSAWVRYLATIHSLSTGGAYALLLLAQFFGSVATPFFQVLGPRYSELWFNLDGRTTATMVMSITAPVGGAIGQLLSPLAGDTRHSILVLAIISTAACPALFLIGGKPPTPPTYAASQTGSSLSTLIRAVCGRKCPPSAYMTLRERGDFLILVLVFSSLYAAVNTFAILTGQILSPVGYSANTSGFLGATLLFAGIIAAVVTAPIMDRVFTHHLAFASKIIVPIIAATWLGFIWAVKPHNLAALYVIMCILGIGSIALLPIGLELGCELTRNADGSSAILWFGGNLAGVVYLLAQNALRAGPDANPPLNMHKALIFNGVFTIVCSSLVFLVKGKQARKELDEQKVQDAVVA
jgi:FLVCR family MFS transporter 7